MSESMQATPQKSGIASFFKVVGILVGVAAVILIGMAVIGNNLGRGSFDGTNSKVYEAMSIYGAGYTEAEADSGVDDIREQANLSHAEAEDVAVQAVRAKLEPNQWGNFGAMSAKLAKLHNDGVIP